MTFYELLGVPRDAPLLSIKKAFRGKVKEFHPDTAPRSPGEGADIHLLLEAYEVLSDPEKRRNYDLTLGPGGTSSSGFNYREWLKERPDPESQSKLMYYDLLRQREAEALELYSQLTSRRAFSLEKSLGKEDFMDCAFLLAEQFEAQGDLSQALFLYLRICELELRRPYFKHFFIEVEDRLRTLVCQKITWQVGPRLLVEVIPQTMNYDFSPRTKGLLWKKQAQTLEDLGQGWEARKALKKALEMAPKEPSVTRLAREWGLGV